MELSRLVLRTVIDKVSTILLSPQYTDTNTFPLPMSALIRSESTEQRLHFISINTCRIALICTLHVQETALREAHKHGVMGQLYSWEPGNGMWWWCYRRSL